jgi:hypothetical protein
MGVEWQGATANVTGVRWIISGLNFGLNLLVDELDGEWRLTFFEFDSTDLGREPTGRN